MKHKSGLEVLDTVEEDNNVEKMGFDGANIKKAKDAGNGFSVYTENNGGDDDNGERRVEQDKTKDIE